MRLVTQESTDDCLRACICSLLELDPDDFGDYVATGAWFSYWSTRLQPLGYAIVEAYASYIARQFPGYWIGLPSSLHDPGGHAVVMRGGDLLHDPGTRRPCYDQAHIDEWLADHAASALLVLPLNPAPHLRGR